MLVQSGSFGAEDEREVHVVIDLIVALLATLIESDGPDILFFQILKRAVDVHHTGDRQIFRRTSRSLGDRACNSDRPTFVAQEFASLVDRLPEMGEFLPGVRRYLLDFPAATLPGSDAFVYWQEANFGLKPTIRINHLVIAEDPSGATIASKMLYASHYFWTALELRVLVRDPERGPGFWFVTVSRSRSDGLSGFVGRVIRGKVRGEAEKGTVAVLQLTKSRFEGH